MSVIFGDKKFQVGGPAY